MKTEAGDRYQASLQPSAPSQRDLPVIVPVSGPGGPAGLGGEAGFADS